MLSSARYKIRFQLREGWSATNIAMGKRRAPDAWIAPPKNERLAVSALTTAKPEVAMTLDQRLNLATMDRFLPFVDLHGMTRDDVRFEIDQLISQNSGEIVRIIYGHGKGIISAEVMSYINQLKNSKSKIIEGFREDPRLASCVIKVK